MKINIHALNKCLKEFSSFKHFYIFGKFVLRLYNLSIKCTVNILSLLHVRLYYIQKEKYYQRWNDVVRNECYYLHFNGCDTNKESVVILLYQGKYSFPRTLHLPLYIYRYVRFMFWRHKTKLTNRLEFIPIVLTHTVRLLP